MKYAVVTLGGKQYKVSEGDIVEVEHINSAEKNLTLDKVLLYVSDGSTKIGNPFISGLTISGSVLGEAKGEKIRVVKYKSKVRHRRVTGHRQHLTRIQIQAIGEKEKKAVAPESLEKPKRIVRKTAKKA